MAHLSDVTHQKLDQRRPVGDEGLDPIHLRGIRKIGGFDAYIRCMEVVTIPGSIYGNVMVWTGDQDGTLSIRRGVTGTILFTMEKKKDVYVSSLLAHGPYMCVGLSDGYLRIFDQQTYQLEWEGKHHSGAITCMCSLGSQLFTGSTDWQVMQWDVKAFRCVGQYSGHQNAVLSMCVEGNQLFTGGDDFAIRCWDLDLAEEKTTPWPIIGHKGGVRSLVVQEVFLFSAANDGTMKVWNTQTGQLVKFLDHREGPITCMMKDPSSDHLWAGGVDGVICVWDTLTLNLVTRMYDHAGTYVNGLSVLSRVNAMKVWSVSHNGVVKVWFSETDTPEADSLALQQQEAELQSTVEQMRATVIQNYEELERRKEQLRKIEEVDARRKEELSVALGRKHTNELKKVYYSKVLKWIADRRGARKRLDIARCLQKGTKRGLLSIYFSKLLHFRQQQKEERRKLGIAETLLGTHERGLAVTYWRKLQEYVRREMNRKKRLELGALLRKNTERGLLSVYYGNMTRWFEGRLALKRKRQLAMSFQTNTARGTMQVYWEKLVYHTRRERERIKQLETVSALMRCTESGMMRDYYLRWYRWKTGLNARRRRWNTAATLARCSDTGLLMVYYRKWNAFVDKGKYSELEKMYLEQYNRNEEVEKLMTLQGGMTEEDIDRQIQEMTLEIESIERETEGIDQETATLTQKGHAVRRELYFTPVKIDTSVSEIKQVEEVMTLLKGKAISCLLDFDRLKMSREEGKGQENKLYESGLKAVKKVVEKEGLKHGLTKAEVFPPSGDWIVVPTSTGDCLPKKAMKQAITGVQDMIIAYDMMTYDKRVNMVHNREVLINASILLDIVLGIHKGRMGADGEGWASPQRGRKGKERTSSKPATPRAPTRSSTSKRTKGDSKGSKKKGTSPQSKGSQKAASPDKGSRKSVGSKKSKESGKKKSPPHIPKLPTKDIKRSASPRPKSTTPRASTPRAGVKTPSQPQPRRAVTPRPSRAAVSPRPGATRTTTPRAGASAPRSSLTPRAGTGTSTGVKKAGKKASPRKPSSPRKSVTPRKPASPKKKGSSPRKPSKKKTPGTKKKGVKKRTKPRSPSKSPGKSSSAKSPSKSPRRSSKKKKPSKPRPWLGMQVDVANPSTCRIEGVIPGGPAVESGITDGDTLVSFGFEPVTTIASFQAAFKKHAKVGEEVPIRYVKGDGVEAGKEVESTIKVASHDDKARLAQRPAQAVASNSVSSWAHN